MCVCACVCLPAWAITHFCYFENIWVCACGYSYVREGVRVWICVWVCVPVQMCVMQICECVYVCGYVCVDMVMCLRVFVCAEHSPDAPHDF